MTEISHRLLHRTTFPMPGRVVGVVVGWGVLVARAVLVERGVLVGCRVDVDVGVEVTTAVASTGSTVGVALGTVVAVGALAVRVANIRWATVASTAIASGVGSVLAQPTSATTTRMNKMINEDFMVPSARDPSGWFYMVSLGSCLEANARSRQQPICSIQYLVKSRHDLHHVS